MNPKVLNISSIALGLITIVVGALLPLDPMTKGSLLGGGGTLFGYGIKRIGDMSPKDAEEL